MISHCFSPAEVEVDRGEVEIVWVGMLEERVEEPSVRLDEDATVVVAAELVAGAKTASLDIWLTEETDEIEMPVAVVGAEAAGWIALLDDETNPASTELDEGLTWVWKVV